MRELRTLGMTRYIDRHQERFIGTLQELVRRPSISTSGEGVRACAAFLVEQMKLIGLESSLLETDGNPLVFGQWAPRPDLPTLLITTHYDVQPAGPLDAWHHPPFEAVRENECLWGRGSSDAKGPVTAVLAAVEAILRSGSLPALNLKVVLDGEEEIGSPSLPGAVERYRDVLLADAVVTFDGNTMPDGRPIINFGGGGLLYLRLDVQTARHDIHPNRGALVPNAAWRLIWALCSMKRPDEEITIDGFADHLVPVSERDRKLLRSHRWDDDVERETLGAFSFLPERGGAHGPEALHLLPIVGVAGLQSGYQEEGVGAVLPAFASAKLYIGLRANQSPGEILKKVRTHLDARGFGDIALTVLGSTEPSSHRTDSTLASIVIDGATSLFGQPPVVYPRGHWYGRQGSWLGSRLGAHAAQVSVVTPAQPNDHAPNEYIPLDYLLRGAKYVGGVILDAERLPRKGTPEFDA